jgi:hypothetical protein
MNYFHFKFKNSLKNINYTEISINGLIYSLNHKEKPDLIEDQVLVILP